jgi:23S rRNA (guanosine2251-2'-O)-methyltransferase
VAETQRVYGIHAVESILNNRPEQVLTVWFVKERNDKRLQTLHHLAEKLGLGIQSANAKKLNELAGDTHHQGVVAEYRVAKPWTEAELMEKLEQTKQDCLLLVLEGIQDPHNLGACLRTADAAGVFAVVIPRDKAASITPIVRKVACGAAEHVPIVVVGNVTRFLETLKPLGIWIKGATGEAKASIFETDFTGKVAIVMGAEGSGLKRITESTCDSLFSIPMNGSVESLNVSVATGICLYEALRQRMRR